MKLLIALAFCWPWTEALKPEVCYDQVGCFNTGPPFTTLLRPAREPQEPSKVTKYMLLYNRNNSDQGFKFDIVPDINLDGLPFDPSKKCYVLVHGYLNSARTYWVVRMRKALLAREDANVLVHHYRQGVQGSYLSAVSNARIMGKLSALVIKKTGIDPKKVVYIGHSLGAQVGSYACKYAQEMGDTIGELWGLDAAGRAFEDTPPIVRIDKTDADFVMLLHTNVGVLGLAKPYGHADFFFNGGNAVPGCYACSHVLGALYAVEAVEAPCMRGHPMVEKARKGVANSLILGSFVKELKQDCGEDCPLIGLDTAASGARGAYEVSAFPFPTYCTYTAK